MIADREIQENIIHAEALSKAFNGVTAVSNLSLTVPAGVIFGFIGPSGCGKTTSVRLMLGGYEPDEGEIKVLNQTPQNFSRQDRAKIGYMPQQFVLYPELTVLENLNFAASLYSVPIRRDEQIKTLLELVELTGHEKKVARKLSGGMQRRLSLAASIIHDPELIFLDEPTTGIDPVLRQKFWQYFQQLKANGRTLFITTQYVGEAAYCDYVGIMANGRLLMVDTPEQLRRRALGGEVVHLYTTSLLTASQFEELKNQPFVLNEQLRRLEDEGVEIVVDDASVTMPQLLNWCNNKNIAVNSAGEHVPIFDEIFVKLIQEETAVAEVSND